MRSLSGTLRPMRRASPPAAGRRSATTAPAATTRSTAAAPSTRRPRRRGLRAGASGTGAVPGGGAPGGGGPDGGVPGGSAPGGGLAGVGGAGVVGAPWRRVAAVPGGVGGREAISAVAPSAGGGSRAARAAWTSAAPAGRRRGSRAGARGEHGRQVRRQAGGAQVGQLLGRDPVDDPEGGGVVGGERVGPQGHRRQGHAQPVHVGGDRGPLALEQLGRHVGEGAGEGVGDRGLDAGHAGDAEVGQAGRPPPVDEDVGGLDVAVEHAHLVCRGQGVGHLPSDHHRGGQRDGPAGQGVVDRPPGQQLHGEVGPSVVGLGRVVDRHHVGVPRELADGEALAGELLEGVVLGVGPVHDLDGDVALEAHLAGAVHGGEPAPADQPEVLVARDDRDRCRHGGCPLPTRSADVPWVAVAAR